MQKLLKVKKDVQSRCTVQRCFLGSLRWHDANAILGVPWCRMPEWHDADAPQAQIGLDQAHSLTHFLTPRAHLAYIPGSSWKVGVAPRWWGAQTWGCQTASPPRSHMCRPSPSTSRWTPLPRPPGYPVPLALPPAPAPAPAPLALPPVAKEQNTALYTSEDYRASSQLVCSLSMSCTVTKYVEQEKGWAALTSWVLTPINTVPVSRKHARTIGKRDGTNGIKMALKLYRHFYRMAQEHLVSTDFCFRCHFHRQKAAHLFNIMVQCAWTSTHESTLKSACRLSRYSVFIS